MLSNHSKAEKIIQKLLLRDQDENQILNTLEKKGLLNERTKQIVHEMNLEFKAAQAFSPRHPPRKRIRTFGIALVTLGVFIIIYFSSFDSIGRYNPTGYGPWLIIIGLILIFFPDQGLEKW
jgi:hypothetical protein